MRVLQVDSGREWRGGQNQVRLLCRELARQQGMDLRLATGRGSRLAAAATAAGVLVHELPWRWGLDPRAVFRLAGVIRSFLPDVIHVHDSHALSVSRFAVGSVTRNDKSSGSFYRRWWRMEGQLPALIAHRRVDFHLRRGSQWFRVDRVIAVSEGVKRVLVEDGVSERDIVVIHDGIDPDEVRVAATSAPDIRKRLNLPPDAPLAVNVAALVDHKDQRTLVHAAAAARGRVPQLHWVIAGDGPLRGALQQEITNQHVGDIVHLVGYVEPVDALIREARVFVMSSKEEGLGSVVLHAFALGTPVVATAAGGLPEMVPAQWLAPVGDPHGLADKVAQALEHPEPLALPERFTAKSMTEAVLAQYQLLA